METLNLAIEEWDLLDECFQARFAELHEKRATIDALKDPASFDRTTSNIRHLEALQDRLFAI